MEKLKELLRQKENGEKLFIFDVSRERNNKLLRMKGVNRVPFDEVASIADMLPDRNVRIYLFCKTGSYSSSAKTVLNYMGYNNVYNLGGITG